MRCPKFSATSSGVITKMESEVPAAPQYRQHYIPFLAQLCASGATYLLRKLLEVNLQYISKPPLSTTGVDPAFLMSDSLVNEFRGRHPEVSSWENFEVLVFAACGGHILYVSSAAQISRKLRSKTSTTFGTTFPVPQCSCHIVLRKTDMVSRKRHQDIWNTRATEFTEFSTITLRELKLYIRLADILDKFELLCVEKSGNTSIN